MVSLESPWVHAHHYTGFLPTPQDEHTELSSVGPDRYSCLAIFRHRYQSRFVKHTWKRIVGEQGIHFTLHHRAVQQRGKLPWYSLGICGHASTFSVVRGCLFSICSLPADNPDFRIHAYLRLVAWFIISKPEIQRPLPDLGHSAATRVLCLPDSLRCQPRPCSISIRRIHSIR